ncbi:helix-turn-helix transcriptional regulator [Paenibacillus macerans]|uniref:DNA binding, excisionase family domain protein n=1 Tax=Paenibacillus macerans TaxID=44252 RepID=A0A090YAP0_PAEMA|nr:helix-turn-helix transcriptional regulator [Paenibacillus macerans]KFM95848.1 DNA binding, excisionase family domain protein [Paenibacillus macerans]MCY7562737.1 helix-turn-helix transcriptional regulator [Paenibacillus macerans]MEC0152797.1 helix-turn-helix transcriptional regulator [Paenibacillus macerans]MEC0330435.1 helix-turn-helix transcriptional regulator [Paenibacillus macerans]SUA83893.1 excisionase family DNA binding domain-containing protein [Paenibacillus macerans]
MTEPISYTTEEIAKLLKVSKLTVYDLIKKGELPAYRVGKQMRVDSTDLEAYKLKAKSGSMAGSTAPGRLGGGPAGFVAADVHLAPLAPVSPPIVSADANEGVKPLVITGQDPGLDLLAKALEKRSSRFRPLRSFASSMDSLVAMYNGGADIVSTHLYDGDTGEYNLPYIRKLFISLPYLVFHFVTRKAGFYVKQGNPLGIAAWEDLTRPDIRLINREKGSGARVLLDEQLRLRGIVPSSVNGYDQEETTHMGLGGRIALGQADVGVGSERPARIAGLDFIPLIAERVDLVVLNKPENREWIGLLREALLSAELRDVLFSLGDYDLSSTGQLIAGSEAGL